MKGEMKPLNLKTIRKVENLTESDRQTIINNTREIFDDDIPIIGYYIVGSFCFNIENPNDIDVVVIIPEEYRKIRFPSNEGIGYDMINKCAQYDVDTRPYYGGIKAQHIPQNPDKFYESRKGIPWQNDKPLVPKYGITHMPYYDLQTGELFHKE
jgi:hypothetical protein